MRLRGLALLVTVLIGAVALGCASGGEDSAARTEPPKKQGTSVPTDAHPAAPAQVARGVRLLRLGTFRQPTYLTSPPGDRRRRFVVERAGRIVVLRGGRKLGTPFLDISDQVQTGGESGLLSMAFAPDYARSRRFYVYYTENNGFLRIEQYRASGDRASRGSARLVLRIPHFRFNHKGGQLQFGPDGLLYAGFGDGGGSGDPDRNAQNRGRILGKLIRIDPRPGGGYRVPRDNPYRGRSGARPEVYAYGLRNPYRFSFDRSKGHLTVGDVGQDAVEEISFVRNARGRRRTPRGGYNFGWSLFEGRQRFRAGSAPGHRPPAVQHTHGSGDWCSITGGYVIRDRAFARSRFYGRYVYGDYCESRLRIAALRRRGRSPSRPLGPRVPGVVSFGEDARGRVYVVSLNGPVYRLAPRR